MFPKTSMYLKDYDEKTNWIYFLTKHDDLFVVLLFNCFSCLNLQERPRLK